MKPICCLLRTLLLLLPASLRADEKSVPSGQEGHGGAVFHIGDAVRLFDALEYQDGFLPKSLPEYQTLLAPQLEVFKTKLPKLGELLQQIFERGINPRWFFVEYSLKKVADDGVTHLVLTYKGEQIALNDDGIIQIQKGLWDKLIPEDRAMLLAHEAIWSAVGDGLVRADSGDSVRKLSSLILDKHLASYAPEEVSVEVGRRASAICATINDCPLYTLSRISWISHPAPGWEDLSTEVNDVKPTTCRTSQDHCVYSDNKTDLYWSPPVAGGKTVADWQGAVTACRNISGWGGVKDWRLPSSAELYEAIANGLETVLHSDPSWNPSYTDFWSNSLFDSNPTFAWMVSLSDGTENRYRTAATGPWVCVAGDYSKNWRDVTIPEGDGSGCRSRGDQCVFLDVKAQLYWSERAPGYSDGDFDQESLSTDWDEAQKECSELGGWGGGNDDWKLPTAPQIEAAFRHGLYRLGKEYADGFGPIADTFWTADWKALPDVFLMEDAAKDRDYYARYFDMRNGQIGNESFKAPAACNNKPPQPEGKMASRGWACVRPMKPIPPIAKP